MEEICLVTALTVSDFIDPDLTVDAHSKTGAQLGVLTLAALLRRQNYVPRIINLDDLFFEFVRLDKSRPSINHDWAGSQPPETFFSFVARHLPADGFDIYGLSSICSSYPLTLRLAQEIRRLNPHARIILGGPQASVVDVATMQAFPCIDIIVRGEADETFPALLHLLDNQLPEWEKLPGITFRHGDEVIRNPNAPVVENLDRLPLPAFDLDLEDPRPWRRSSGDRPRLSVRLHLLLDQRFLQTKLSPEVAGDDGQGHSLTAEAVRT